MFAVIKTGGKQYKVALGDKIKIEKIAGKQGDEVVFNQVLLVGATLRGRPIKIGQSLVKEAKVIGKILAQGKDKKKIVFKYKPKKRYKVKKGHRQLFTEVEITKIYHSPTHHPSRHSSGR